MNMQAVLRPAVLYIECTPTIRLDHGAGIARVVRNIVQHAVRNGRDRGIDVRPIAFSNGNFFEARLTAEGKLVTRTESDRQARWRRRAKVCFRATVHLTGRILPAGRARQWWMAPGADPGLTMTLRDNLRWFRTSAAELLNSVAIVSDAVQFAQGDTVLAAEPLLDRNYVAAFLALRDKGVKLACVVHDLAPIRFPHQVPARFRVNFRRWVDGNLAGSDLVVAISSTVRDDLADYFTGLASAARPAGRRLAWFHLGQDLDRALPDGKVRAALARIFDDRDSGTVFLMVGWLHPRKNHTFVLDALERLHREGISARLVLIGRRDLAADGFYRRVGAHADLARQVFVFHDATDTELAYCYRRSSALVYPSISEGFGLPLVEALGYGLRVFASDIPVFREIGEGYVSFFPLDDPEVLTGKLRRFCMDGHFDARRPIAEFRWPTWRESIERLLDIVLEPDGASDTA